MISQRKSPPRGVDDAASAPRESGPAADLWKFMSVILTYLRFNVTKLPSAAKHYVVSFATAFEVACESQRWRPRPVNWTTVRLSSGISANILDFTIPQKHVLRACGCGNRPQGRAGVEPSEPKTAARVRLIAPIRERTHGGFVGKIGC